MPTPSFEEQIRRYTEELQAYNRRHNPTPEPPPLPDFQRDLAAMSDTVTTDEPTFPYTDGDLDGQLPVPEDAPAPPEEGPAPHTGYLRVYVFGAAGAQPLENARVAVSRPQGDSETLFANLSTNRDGFTPVIPLPTVDPALSLTPDGGTPYVLYNIAVSADGFVPALYDNVPIYGETYVTQPAALTPLRPGEENPTAIFESGGPENL